MNSDTRIEILLRSTHLNRDSKTLQHLPDITTQNMQSNNLLLRSLTHNLEFSRVLRALIFLRVEIVEHGGEFRLVDFDIVGAEFLLGGGFGEAD